MKTEYYVQYFDGKEWKSCPEPYDNFEDSKHFIIAMEKVVPCSFFRILTPENTFFYGAAILGTEGD